MTSVWFFFSRMLTEEEALDEFEDEDFNTDNKITWEEHAAETYGIYDDDKMTFKNLPDESQVLFIYVVYV